MHIIEYFEEVETERSHKGHSYSVGEALTLVTLGSLCGLRNTSQIHQWAENDRVADFLRERFGIRNVPSYSWLLRLLALIDPRSLDRCFTKWAQSLLPESGEGLTLAFDGKAIRSAGKREGSSALHIVSAHLGDLGVTIGQRTVGDKANEIPALRELLAMLRVAGMMIVADAIHCQTETAAAIVAKKADYLLSVKDNQKTLKKDIEDYVKDPALRGAMAAAETVDKGHGRVEVRTAYATCDTGWLHGGVAWANLACIGAIHTRFTGKKGTSDEWHYYISSRELTAEDLLRHARLEWSVESMHWLLDVRFGEDFCRVEDANAQQCLNMVRKIALNTVRRYKEKAGSKHPFSKIMLNCLIDRDALVRLLTFADGETNGDSQK